MANEHPAFFGNDPDESQGADASRGIPADLIPYLEAADAPNLDDEDIDEADAAPSPESSPLRGSFASHTDGSPSSQASPDLAATTSAKAQHEGLRDDSERQAALRALVEHSLLLGPDPSILAEIESDGDDDEWFDGDDEAGSSSSMNGGAENGDGRGDHATGRMSHDDALDEAARDLERDAQVKRIYHSIVERAPEHSVQPSLERVRAVLDILGDPQNSYPTIHITGTNGKTSTARIIDSLLTAFGMRTGRFTSPHLVDVRERICLEGQPISRDGFIRAWEDVEPYIGMVDERSKANGGPRLSFFEVFTVMALAAFADYPVDAGVIEVGMGGRWDATNTIDSGVAVITPISKDHTKWLGSTIREIATEKAGIIKPGQIVVVAQQPDEALEILCEKARDVDAIVRLEGRDFDVLDRQMGVGGQLVTIRTPSAVYEDVFVPLFGEYQASNAALALVAVEAFMGGRQLDGRIVEQGMMNATSPGRLQVVRTSPTILVDSAHNPAGAATLGDAVEESFGFTHTVGVYSAMADKDIETVLAQVEPYFDAIVVTQMPGERAASVDELRAIAADVFGPDRVDVREDLADAVDRAAELAEASTDPADRSGVVVFGSVMLAGEMLTLAGHRP
ncbi:folylpolyglutamate synthase/dihydrofolate synthase family protein [Schaalia sp. ZJ1691]|uniref:bifunctional folylpolyglutamate synthase/dihydrofolate synthase n=1 Tax=Schaalia sp. ZJ1691 TaxID=2709404 RepID=UPI0013ECF26B|nr:folylpolyglutamate synthase/dihydrofolate synthase family protein [Schaalia sp. ZJ1691]